MDEQRNNDFVVSLEVSDKKHSSRLLFFPFLFLAVFFGLSYWCYILTTAPASFAAETLLEIPAGYSLQSIGKLLQEKSIIRSPLYFSLLVAHEGKEKNVSAGMYLFKQPLSVFEVAHRLALGEHGIEIKKITLPEGITIKEMSATIAREIPQFDSSAFLNEADGKEGYLFPDTYFFYSTATSGPIESTLEDNFVKKTAALKAEALSKKKNWSDVVTMASIIEGEAVTALDRRMVAQILWQRLFIGMRLQVDAPFVYTMGKGSLQLSLDDLNSDSPYNTYRNKGLPPTPIGNPGLDALDAAMHPATTTYLYYLSDKDSVMHYAKTFNEHKLNKAKYLK